MPTQDDAWTSCCPAEDTERNFEREAAPVRLLYPVRDAMVLLSMSRTTIYEQIRTGRLRSVRQGSSRLIPAKALNEYVELLENEAKGEISGEAA